MKILVLAPHPDDETLGCGGSLLRHKYEGDELYWCIITNISKELGWSEESIKTREKEIKAIEKKYSFSKVFNFKIPTTKVDTVPISDLIQKITDVCKETKPDIVFLPFAGDIHTDHQLISKASQSTLKWFRQPSIKKVLMYETLSETNLNFISKHKFNPNYFVNINRFIDKKIKAMKIYKSEINKHPFPRSVESIKSLAILRGSQVNLKYAESFEIIYDIIDK